MKKKSLKGLFMALIAFAMVIVMAGCKKEKKSDYDSIKEKGFFRVGITLYEPMDYIDEDGETVLGFDADLARAVAADLNLQVKFQVISWDEKFLELNSGSIDAIWNGFTVDDERKGQVDFSLSYLNNSQCVVVKNTADYTNKDQLKGLKAVAEAGSAGADTAKKLAGSSSYTDVDSQMKALTEVLAGTADFAVVDITLATANCGKGDYATLKMLDSSITNIEPEEYAIGFRKGSDFTSVVNESLKKLYNNGKIAEIAAKYGLSNAVCEIK